MSSLFQTESQASSTALPPERYNEEMQQSIIALASQLQHQYQGTASAAELESIAAEVGLEARFVRQAIAQVASRPVADATREASSVRKSRMGFWNKRLTSWSKNDIALLVVALIADVCLSINDSGAGLATPFIFGALTGPKRKMGWAGATLGLVEFLAFGYSHGNNIGNSGSGIAVCFLAAIASLSSVLGAVIRGFVSPPENSATVHYGESADSHLQEPSVLSVPVKRS